MRARRCRSTTSGVSFEAQSPGMPESADHRPSLGARHQRPDQRRARPRRRARTRCGESGWRARPASPPPSQRPSLRLSRRRSSRARGPARGRRPTIDPGCPPPALDRPRGPPARLGGAPPGSRRGVNRPHRTQPHSRGASTEGESPGQAQLRTQRHPTALRQRHSSSSAPWGVRARAPAPASASDRLAGRTTSETASRAPGHRRLDQVINRMIE
jgi:hypothetical protein